VAGTSITFTATVSSSISCAATNGQTTAPAGTVAFTVTNEAEGSTPITGTVTVDANGNATFTPSTPLAAGTYDVTATFTPSNSNYAASSSGKLVEQIVAASSAVGTGTVSTAGTSTSSVTLRGGQTASIDITQGLDSTTANGLGESGSGITYVDATQGINLTSTAITSVVFDSNGNEAEITGTGTNVNNGTSTSVTFTMLVNSGDGQWFSMPSVRMTIQGTGINYQQSGTVVSGSLSVDGTGSTTSILPSGSSGNGGWSLGGGGQGGRGFGGGGQGGWGFGRGGQGGWGLGGSGGSGGGGSSGSTGTGSTGTGTGSTGTGTGSTGTGTGSTGTGSTGTGGSGGSTGSGSTASTATTSSNWSGYAAATNLNSSQSGSVTAVSGTWELPTATATSSSSTAYSSVWVGIDGYNSSSVEQLGTDSDVVNGKATYYVWYEMYPQNSVNVTSMTISPGDTISASVQYLTTGSHAGQFELSITDTSQANDSFTIYESGSGLQRSSAEWVVEAPSSTSGILPLANFGSVAFTNASATINGVTGPIDDSAWQSTAINMVSGATTEASTSGLTDSNGTSSFSVGYQSSSSVGSS
jgi:hypothetical protein